MFGREDLFIQVVIISAVIISIILLMISLKICIGGYKKKIRLLNREIEELKSFLKEKEDLLQSSDASKNNNEKYFALLLQEVKKTINSFNGILDSLTGEFDFLSNDEKIESISQLKELLITSSNKYESIVSIKSLGNYRDVYNPKQILVMDLLSDTLKQVRQFAEMKKILFHVDVEPGLEVFVNSKLMSNALETLINIAIESKSVNSQVFIQAINTGGIAKISLHDYSVGISEETKCLIYSNKKIDFSGILTSLTSIEVGLVFAKELILRCGGDFWLHSSLNEGTKLTFSLPVSSKKEI